VLFSKPQVSYETVNDLHQDLINLALVVQNPDTGKELYEVVTRTLFDEDMLPRAKDYLLTADWRGSLDVQRAYWYLVFSWMGLNGVSGTLLSGTGTFAVRYSAKGGNGPGRWRSVIESLPDWHQRLSGVQILRRDGFELLEKLDDACGTAIYADPPYLVKSAKYVHDFKPEDHARLATILGRFKCARVVVSYYDHPSLSELYPGWNKLICSVAKSMVNSGKRDQRGRTDAPEVLLVNGKLIVDPCQKKLFAE
jgi:DNA adenine methylase